MSGIEQFIIDNLFVILYIPIAILFVAFTAAIIKQKKDKNG